MTMITLCSSAHWQSRSTFFIIFCSESFWLGNEVVHQLTTQSGQAYRARFEVKVWSGEWISAEYDTFQVLDEATNAYRILISGYSGDAGDAVNPGCGSRATEA